MFYAVPNSISVHYQVNLEISNLHRQAVYRSVERCVCETALPLSEFNSDLITVISKQPGAQMHFPVLHRAISYTVKARMGQERKYTNTPYIAHPINVMQIVRSVSNDEAMLTAAVLHDVVEDTPITVEEVYSEFGERVSELVAELTDVSKPEDGNRAFRKALDR